MSQRAGGHWSVALEARGDVSRGSLAGLAVEDRMFRALGVLRVVLILNSAGIAWVHRHDDAHPLGVLAVLMAIAGWTAFATWAYADPARRGPMLLLCDLAVAVAAIGVSPLVEGSGISATVPGFWVMSSMLAMAVHWRWQGGLLAATFLSIVDLSVRSSISLSNYGNVFLLMVGGPIVGFLSGLLQRMAAERDVAQRAAAAAAERDRLGRVVHDGVLQALALVQRRGAELGGEAAELGRIAGEQEVVLRSFVQQGPSTAAAGGERDLREILGALQTAHVQLALPADPFLLPAGVAEEVGAAVAAALSNVRHHVGSDAAAWILLEGGREQWAVSVRDAGPGIPEGRLDEAAAQGRLGVASSIIGRVHDLGGEVSLHTAPRDGTEWEFTFSKRSLEDGPRG